MRTIRWENLHSNIEVNELALFCIDLESGYLRITYIFILF